MTTTATPTISGVTPEEFNSMFSGAKNLRWVSIVDLTPGMLLWATRAAEDHGKKISYASKQAPYLLIKAPLVKPGADKRYLSHKASGVDSTGNLQELYLSPTFEFLVSDSKETTV